MHAMPRPMEGGAPKNHRPSSAPSKPPAVAASVVPGRPVVTYNEHLSLLHQQPQARGN